MQGFPLLTRSVSALALACVLFHGPSKSARRHGLRPAERVPNRAPVSAPSRPDRAVPALAEFTLTEPLQPIGPTRPVGVAASTALFTLTDLGTLGGDYSAATAINQRGQIIGDATSAHSVLHGFLWENGRMRQLYGLGRGLLEPRALNDRGDVAGYSYVVAPILFDQHAVLWSDGRVRDLGMLPGCRESIASAINNAGQVVGTSHPGQHPFVGQGDRAFLWQNARMVDLNDSESRRLRVTLQSATGINDHGVLVGTAAPTDTKRPFFSWGFVRNTHGAHLLTAGPSSVVPVAVDASGAVIANAAPGEPGAPGLVGAVVWRNGAHRQAVKEAQQSSGPRLIHSAAGLNSTGQIVGSAGPADDWIFPDGFYSHAYLADGSVIWDLNQLPIAGPPWLLTEAVGINDRGQIAWNAAVGGHTHAVLLTPTMPLPQLLQALHLMRLPAAAAGPYRKRSTPVVLPRPSG